MKDLIKTVIFDQQRMTWNKNHIARSYPENIIKSETIVVISGIRRCGKSTLLSQIRNENGEKDFYMNFDDERLIRFSVDHFQLLHETFIELFGIQKTFYFDEIQNIPDWERFIRRLHDEGYKVFLTGSNASMLSRELGTHLTGRYVQIELFPFSFAEFLTFKQVVWTEKDYYSTEGRASLIGHFNEYFHAGGFPLYLKEGSDDYLKSLYESILYRDVLVRNKLVNERELLELVNYLASNVSKLSSFNGLTKIAGVKNATTIRNYLSFLQDTYLIFQICKFDYSLKKQIQNHKKTYFIDNAMIRLLGFMFSEEKGRLLENIVFLELRRRRFEIFYHFNRLECDFVIREGITIVQAIQVCHSFNTAQTKTREVSGLLEAMNVYGLEEGLILLQDTQEHTIEENGKVIRVMPVWKWLLK
ncbi:MAG: ATP-binding protein [bacterium]